MSDLKERLADMSALSQSRTPADALKYIMKLEAENKRLRLQVQHANEDAKELRAERAKAVEIAQKAIEQLRLYGGN